MSTIEESLARQFDEWADTCAGYEADHHFDRQVVFEALHRGGKEAFRRCAEALRAKDEKG